MIGQCNRTRPNMANAALTILYHPFAIFSPKQTGATVNYTKTATILLGALSMATGGQLSAATPVTFDSAVFVEHTKPGDVRMLEPADRLSRGDRVVTIVTWKRNDAAGASASGFTVTNPMPRAIAYQDSASDDTEVSADGGRTWGKLGTLRIGNRYVTAEDVTHVRWRIAPRHAAQGSGQIAYSGIVR